MSEIVCQEMTGCGDHDVHLPDWCPSKAEFQTPCVSVGCTWERSALVLYNSDFCNINLISANTLIHYFDAYGITLWLIFRPPGCSCWSVGGMRSVSC